MDATSNCVKWSTNSVDERSRYDRWVSTLNQTFGTWQADSFAGRNFGARLNATTLPGMAVVECQCDPCGATRSHKDVSKNDSEQLTIQLVVAGSEYMQLGDHEAMLSKGDVFVWDNTQPMRFSVKEPLHKISLVLPLERFKSWAPNSWRDLPRHLHSGEPSAALLGNYVRSLAGIDFDNNPMRYNALIEAAIAILIAPVTSVESDSSHRLSQLELIKAKIQQQLRDPDLDLASIAQANRISVRYLHWLFELNDCTPWRFIVQQRLEGCKRDLQNPELRNRNITEIAFAWGFSNSAHFGRKVKAAYGVSPSELRSQSCAI